MSHPAPDATSFTIRTVEPGDVAEIFRLVRELAIYEHLEDMLVATESDFREALFGANAVIRALVALAEARAVGYAIYFYNFSTFLGRPGIYLEDIFVEPEYRGRGIGKALLQRLASIAVEQKCGRMEWTVLDWNQPSIDFYERIGAKRLTEWQLCRLTGDSLSALAQRS